MSNLTREAFFSVYKGLEGLRREARFENWLYRIAMNVYWNEVERRQAKKRAARHFPLDEARSRTEHQPIVVEAGSGLVNPTG